MSYVVDIVNSYPPPSSVAWTQAKLEESATRSGSWSLIETITLAPVDTEPGDPQARSFHSEHATLPAGWYRVTWLDSSGDQSVSDPVFAGSGVRPTVQEVARLMPDRATAMSGAGLPNFDDTTEPTDDAVDGLIDVVLDAVDPHVPDGATAEIQRAARNVVSLTVAILVETGYFGEQRDVNDAKVRVWEGLLATHQATLDAVAQDDQPGGVRFGSIPVQSPTITAWQAQVGLIGSELLP